MDFLGVFIRNVLNYCVMNARLLTKHPYENSKYYL